MPWPGARRRKAIALDPKYAEAYALLGATDMNDVFIGTSRPQDSIAKAIEWTQKGPGHERLAGRSAQPVRRALLMERAV